MTDKQQDECNAIIHNATESAIAETKGSVQVPAWDNEKLLPIELGMIIALGKVFGIENYTSQAVASHACAFTGKLTATAAVTNADKVTLTPAQGASGTLREGDLLTVGGKTVAVTSVASGAGSSLVIGVTPAVTAASGAEFTPVASHTANLVFHPNAFAFVTRPLAAPAGVESYVTTYNGISLRVVRGYDMKYKRDMLSMDVLYAFRTIYPELAVRYDLG